MTSFDDAVQSRKEIVKRKDNSMIKKLYNRITATKPGWSTTQGERMTYYSYFSGQNIIYTLVSTYLVTYLMFQGITPVKSASVMLIVKIWDAVNDTLFGVIFDKVKFKSGKKYLPWIKVSTILIPISTLLIFFIPSAFAENAKLAWFAVTYILWDVAYTLCDVPIFAIITSMTNSLDERNTVISYKSIWTYIGVGVTTVVATVLVSEKVGANYSIVAVILCLIAFATMQPASFKLKERYHSAQEETFTVRAMFRYLLHNKYLLIYYLGYFFYAALNIQSALNLYVSYYLFNSSLFSLVVTALGVAPSAIVSLMIPHLIRRFDKMKLYRMSMALVSIIGVIMYLVGYGKISGFIILSILRSIPLAVVSIAMALFTPDCAEYGKYKTGIEAKGITFAIQTFVAKLTAAISGALGLFLLGLKSVGWTIVEVESFKELEQSGIVQSAHALDSLWFFYVFVPTIGCILAWIVWEFYRLKDKDVQIMADCNSGLITREEAEKSISRKY